MMRTDRLVETFLRRRNAAPTWVYENRVLLALELCCLAALVLAAPSREAAVVVLGAGAVGLDASLCAQACRSAAARKAAAARRELSEIPPEFHPGWHRLACERAIERAAARGQLHAILAPVVVLLAAAVQQGGLTGAAITSAAVGIARAAWGFLAYPAWRRWWEARR